MPVTRAEGLRLARNIPSADPRQMPLLRAGATLSGRYCDMLGTLGLRLVWVTDDLSDGIEPVDLVSEDLRQDAARTVSATLDGARRAFNRGEQLGPDALAELQDVADQIGESVSRHP